MEVWETFPKVDVCQLNCVAAQPVLKLLFWFPLTRIVLSFLVMETLAHLSP